jgi:Raf kinase inhibitor-like YbhB/YbcL family protein
MLGIRHALATVTGVLLLAGAAIAAEPFTITSSAFKDGGMLAIKNAGANKSNPNCGGENISPPLAWTNMPEGTKSFALLMTDPEGQGGLGSVHWVAYGIPASVTSFAEGEVSKPSDKYVGGKGSAGQAFYVGPCTPPNTTLHHYTFTLIATDLDPKELPASLIRDELLPKLKGHSKGGTGLIGLFKKP